MNIFQATLKKFNKKELPMIPLKDIVVFPRMVVPFFVGRKRSVCAVEEAMSKGKLIFLTTQEGVTAENSSGTDKLKYGTVTRILQLLKLPDGSLRVLVEGLYRAGISQILEDKNFFKVQIKRIKDEIQVTPQIKALIRSVKNEFAQYTTVQKKVPVEVTATVEKIEQPHKLIDTICAHISLKISKKIELLSIVDTEKRLESLLAFLIEESELIGLERQINTKVRKKLEKTHKNYYLNEQLKQIQKELGQDDKDVTGVIELEKNLKEKKLPDDTLEKSLKELKRLARLQPVSPEAGVLRTYLEWICDLPWNEYTQENGDLEQAKEILELDHYGLKKVKDRILDFIAVRQLRTHTDGPEARLKGPILCLAGPPGTGKTSLGRSIARAMGREFIRISLGGIRDEAEIRGHRKTYIGALPGKILQAMRKVKSSNAVFLLDEIDKISADYRGDPASALLEVLDPEQNSTFMDHYLEVPYDLSHVLFITTANSAYNIPYALRDRMEIIEIDSYTESEKQIIAAQFLIPKQQEENGLRWAEIIFQKNTLLSLIRHYTMEAGVRNLEREISQIMRKIAREILKQGVNQAIYKQPDPIEAVPRIASENTPAIADAPGPQESQTTLTTETLAIPVSDTCIQAPAAPESYPGEQQNDGSESKPNRKRKFIITDKLLEKYLGKIRYEEILPGKIMQPGLAYGLAWTEMGGTLLPVEIVLLKGTKGEILLTGNLGEVMKESAHAALSFLRANYRQFNISAGFHIHVPEGAIPKDGPSAGITITAALLSAITGICLKPLHAMTGEITLTGRLLPIGGVKEKILAAHRNKMTHVLLPEQNRKDMDDIPPEVASAMQFIYKNSLTEALASLFPTGSFIKKNKR